MNPFLSLFRFSGKLIVAPKRTLLFIDSILCGVLGVDVL
jgi:hypothetical protein